MLNLPSLCFPSDYFAYERTNRKSLAGPFAGLASCNDSARLLGLLARSCLHLSFFWRLCPISICSSCQARQSFVACPRRRDGGSVGSCTYFFSTSSNYNWSRSRSFSRASTQNYYGYGQVLRFFHEGIYGRYFEEGRLLGHGMNLSEGLQLVFSSALSLFVCIGIARPRIQMPRSLEPCYFMRFFSL